ncbi:unnamed protein product [Microthlaspi erraticum]|uniref:B box-type domain-containing protein n=1 Tax=Microthlaspi erraticum TaxID=1685480 RepID=A0A6D2KHX4_9BRAS|nr:unnamed protein product [Microthlaspi erraticum]CAA7047315.1 unnamed protein product [Microthlaspi erraticum]
MNNSATISCSIHRTILCQPCYSLRYNCATYGHQIQILQQHVHAPQEQQQVNVPQQQHNYGGDQRREGMFEFSCNGDNSCERWMLAMNCEACLASNAVVYCAEHDQVLCSNCDLMIHYSDDVVPPHMRSVLCVTCKRVSRSFRIGGHLFNLPPPIPPAAPDEVSASVTTGPYLP